MLQIRGQVNVPATEEFNLLDFFRMDNPNVHFGRVDGDLGLYFQDKHLIPAEGPRQLILCRLLSPLPEPELISAVEGTTWADAKWLLEQQPRGQAGFLPISHLFKLFWIDSCLVRICWRGGWEILVCHPCPENVWPVDNLAVSR